MARLTDEIVDEIHALRLQHAAGFDNNMARILDDLCASQQSRVAQGWLVIKTIDSPSEQAGASLQRSRFAQCSGASPAAAQAD